MPRKIRLLLLALTIVFVLATLAVLVSSVRWTPSRPPLPKPNGYEDFLKAKALLTGDANNASALDPDALRAFVSTNSESLRLLRLGLTRQCALPAESSMMSVAGMRGQLAGMKQLAQLLAAEGRQREMDNRLSDAAQIYVDAIHFGNEMSRGGFIVNRNMGAFCELIGGVIPLCRLVPKLNPEESHRVLARLNDIDSAGVTWNEVRREANRFDGYQGRTGFNPITLAMIRWKEWRLRKASEVRHKWIVTRVRLLATELAVICYRSEQGYVPTRLGELVPNYLFKVPQDPFSDQPLVYHLQGTNWILYSVGLDGKDDGGKRAGSSIPGAVTREDLFYDSPF